jgi:hypothetical protein
MQIVSFSIFDFRGEETSDCTCIPFKSETLKLINTKYVYRADYIIMVSPCFNTLLLFDLQNH